MKLTKIIAASVLAISMPFAASAATMLVNGSPESITSAEPFVLSLSESSPNYTIIIAGTDGETGPLAFTLNNEYGYDIIGSISGDVEQNSGGLGSYGFFSAANDWFFSGGTGGLAIYVGEDWESAVEIEFGADGDFNFDGGLGAGESTSLTFFFDFIDCEGNACPVINFDILTAPAPIPLPAAGFMLIGALGGLAAFRRRS